MRTIPLIWLLAILLFSQQPPAPALVAVINAQGAAVYERPAVEAPIVTRMRLGHVFRIDREVPTEERFVVGEGLSFAGRWLKPAGVEGYVFSTDVTDKSLVWVRHEASGRPIPNLLGELVSDTESRKMIATENGEFPEVTRTTTHAWGSIEARFWDGCGFFSIRLGGLTAPEAYHFLMNDQTWQESTVEGTSFRYPTFTGFALSTASFDSEVENLRLFFSADGTSVMSFHVCF